MVGLDNKESLKISKHKEVQGDVFISIDLERDYWMDKAVGNREPGTGVTYIMYW